MRRLLIPETSTRDTTYQCRLPPERYPAPQHIAGWSRPCYPRPQRYHQPGKVRTGAHLFKYFSGINIRPCQTREVKDFRQLRARYR